jgi:hypothetical protein
MPRPLKVKIFMGEEPSELEKQVNVSLSGLGSAAIIKMETAVSSVAENQRAPYIVVTIRYEPPEES